MDIKDINLIKHNLACGSKYRCLRVKWDTSQDQIAVSGSRTQTMVRLSLLLNAVAVMARIFIIFTHPLNLIEQAEASIAMASYAMGFLIRLDIPIDHVAVHLVNFLIRQPVQKFGKNVVWKHIVTRIGGPFVCNDYDDVTYIPKLTENY